MLSRRRHFVRVQTAEINAAKRLLRSAGLGRASRDLRRERGWATVLQAVAPYGDVRADLEQHRAVWRCAGEQIQALEALPCAARAGCAERGQKKTRRPVPYLRHDSVQKIFAKRKEVIMGAAHPKTMKMVD
jgi:hypothetical protein